MTIDLEEPMSAARLADIREHHELYGPIYDPPLVATAMAALLRELDSLHRELAAAKARIAALEREEMCTVHVKRGEFWWPLAHDLRRPAAIELAHEYRNAGAAVKITGVGHVEVEF